MMTMFNRIYTFDNCLAQLKSAKGCGIEYPTLEFCAHVWVACIFAGKKRCVVSATNTGSSYNSIDFSAPIRCF